ncbi:MAG: exodeoxyribonuclease VII large subunit [bacterium]|nr:exodeoxyribonuclease VII large subunit [bacterium]
MKGGANLSLPENVLTVKELIGQIREELESAFTSLWVTGEISNLRTPQSGHTYFTLKDAEAQIQGVFFKHKKRYIRFEPEDRLAVLCKGVVTVYEARGGLQLNVDYMEPLGVGALHVAFEQIKARLEKEGLFDRAHKKVLPVLPRRIGVITSPSGAAVQDILHVINRRYGDVGILIAPVRVQGEQAAAEIVAAIEQLNRRGDLDVLILARGGGSIEDLWAFNEEAVARAIYASEIPLVSAVGHETDFTIADFVADFRAPTPSAAAELVVQNKLDLHDRINQLTKRLVNEMGYRVDRYGADLKILVGRLVTPERRIEFLQQHLDELNMTALTAMESKIRRHRGDLERFQTALRFLNPREQSQRFRERLKVLKDKLSREIRVTAGRKRDRLSSLSSRLETLSPLHVLSRGYSIVYRLADEEIIRDVRSLSAGDRLRLRLHHGRADCTVDHVEEG